MQRESEIFINRELSWLEFNRRVMDLSREKAVPLAEQLNFAAIYGSNLDEFFMIRVGSLYDQTLLKDESKENKTGMTPQQQLDAIMPKVNMLQKQCDKNVLRLFNKLERYGLQKVDFTTLDKEHVAFWKKLFLSELYPVLSPQIIGRRHPFPFLRNMDIYIGAMISEKKGDEPVFGLIPVSTQFDRMIVVNDGDAQCFALVEELILQFADLVFGKGVVLSKCLFRITRNADINVEEGMFDHDIDYRVVMSELLKKRRKLAAVRLQFFGEPPEEIKHYLLEKIELPENQCMWQKAPLELSFLHSIYGRLEKLDEPKLFYSDARPIMPAPGYDLYQEVQQHDVLICYPYHSMRPFIKLLHQAARDPDVISIKMTLYRVASESKVIEALISAAENGKEVVTIVELRARFDEQKNIDWSRQLEQAGCTVIYGFSEYKVHSKLTLITRRSGSRFEYITQIGTGNYNEKTSELYTDLAYITKNPVIGEEVAAVFNNLAIERHTQRAAHLIVAPLVFKTVLIDEILEEKRWLEQGGESRVILKCNSISDKKVIETLSEASIAGVPIDMIVRGICCLQAGLPGLTDNIRVRSIVGRYLEHSRIYAFGAGERTRVYIASGDFLTRNTERRVEVGVRIDDPEIKQTLLDILNMQLSDNVSAREMQPDGSYSWVERDRETPKMDSQMAMYPYLEAKLRSSPPLSHVEASQAAMDAKSETAASGDETDAGSRSLPPTPRRRRLFRRIWRLFRR
ncbi:polyphosphate kinase 1 [Ruminococcaceae bacterium OttesenSCG-928-D13]|nr:polyphosphate kinase 1 [Ruminococcaceae bacterium OttesenSCG-928-D13]